MYRSLMIAELTTRIIESTVDMIAAMGAAKRAPATHPGKRSTIILGTARSPTGNSG
jgi:hypothetical protein